MNHPLVSVPIPTYNSGRFIAETLESLLAQSYPNIEVIVIDDGSTDDTAETLRPYLGRITYHRQGNAGLGAARNAGMRLARGEYIAWCDADDICEPDRLLTQVAYLAHSPEVLAVGSNFAAFDGDGRVFDPAHATSFYSELALHGLAGVFQDCEDFDGRSVPWLGAPLAQVHKVYWGKVWHRLLLGNFMHPPTMMIRASACAQAGWLQEDLRTSEDWDYIVRIARLGAIAFIDAPLLRYRRHANQMTTDRSAVPPVNFIRMYESHMRLAREAGLDVQNELEARLAESHAGASYALAERSKMAALRHLLTAVRLNPRKSRAAFHLARILAPSSALRMLRLLRGTHGDGSTRRSKPDRGR